MNGKTKPATILAPDLSETSTDFADGIYAVNNLVPGKEGLHLKQAGEGHVVFEVFTPYLIVAKVNDLEDFSDDTQASVVAIESFLPVNAAVSLDNGITWEAAGKFEPGGKTNLDLNKPDDYTIECDGEPENVFIEMTVPSG